jgi:NAD(P)H dehydrogenase (quinone)
MATAVAITGATGNIGRALAERLLKRGVSVRAIGRTADRLRPLLARGAEAHVGDLRDPDFLARAFRGAGAVFAMIRNGSTWPIIMGTSSAWWRE